MDPKINPSRMLATVEQGALPGKRSGTAKRPILRAIERVCGVSW